VAGAEAVIDALNHGHVESYKPESFGFLNGLAGHRAVLAGIQNGLARTPSVAGPPVQHGASAFLSELLPPEVVAAVVPFVHQPDHDPHGEVNVRATSRRPLPELRQATSPGLKLCLFHSKRERAHRRAKYAQKEASHQEGWPVKGGPNGFRTSVGR
jgi:hypothetical protein